MPTLLSTLCEMHTYCRPHGSGTEKAFIDRYVASLPGAYQDSDKNWHVDTDPTSETLWSCHTDTVHHKAGRQTAHYDRETHTLSLSKRSAATSSCLGADDTVGVFLLREMILAGVPGHYMFHYGEEAGGIGSSAFARSSEDFLKRFKRAIALDRGGRADVITHQSSGRTCSQTFALALADLLNMNYAPCEGIYTDTVEYAAVIPECTNLSVGYFNAHRASECVDVAHVLRLLSTLLTVDVSTLPADRTPEAPYYSGFDWDGYFERKTAANVIYIDRVSHDCHSDDDDNIIDACDLDDCTVDELEAEYDQAVDDNDWRYAALLAQLLETRRADDAKRESAYLDPDYADIQRLLLKNRDQQ